jgi:hypothetical protein
MTVDYSGKAFQSINRAGAKVRVAAFVAQRDPLKPVIRREIRAWPGVARGND